MRSFREQEDQGFPLKIEWASGETVVTETPYQQTCIGHLIIIIISNNSSIRAMRDNWHIQTKVIDDSPLSLPQEADEEEEPYLDEGREGINEELLSVGIVNESLEHSRQSPEGFFIEKQPKLIRSLRFDEPVRERNCIKDMEYLWFLSASIKQHQILFFQPSKVPLLSVDKSAPFSQ